MKSNKTLLKRIASYSPAFRVHLARDCKKHSEAQCNGDYYFDEDKNAWVGYNGTTHTAGDLNAITGERREKSIIKRICEMCGTKKVPDILSYTQDVRGFVIKIMSDKLTEEERELCRNLGFAMDWGHDFAIVKNDEL